MNATHDTHEMWRVEWVMRGVRYEKFFRREWAAKDFIGDLHETRGVTSARMYWMEDGDDNDYEVAQ